MMRGVAKKPGFTTPVGKVQTVGPEYSIWFWNPNRPEAKPAPEWFTTKLREVDPDKLIDVRWNPLRERWVVFYKNHKIQHKICSGWMVMFVVEDPLDRSYMPLDERTLATLYNASAAKWGNGKEYFLAVERELEREREKKDANSTQEAIDRAMPTFEYSQIKNIGKGNKFSEYHS